MIRGQKRADGTLSFLASLKRTLAVVVADPANKAGAMF